MPVADSSAADDLLPFVRFGACGVATVVVEFDGVVGVLVVVAEVVVAEAVVAVDDAVVVRDAERDELSDGRLKWQKYIESQHN